MRKGIIFGLFIPLLLILTIILIISIVFSSTFPTNDFLINVSTEIIGILITVSYVAWFIQKNEQNAWKIADDRINKRMRITLNVTVSSIRVGLGLNPDILDEKVLSTHDEILIHQEIIKMSDTILLPDISYFVPTLTPDDWKRLSHQISNSRENVQNFFSLFQSRLTPTQISLMLDLLDNLFQSLTMYITFPEMAGVSINELPKSKTPPHLLQEMLYSETIEKLENSIILVKQLSQSIESSR